MVGWLTAGCAERQARAAFASDFDCPQAQVEATNTEAHFRVHGCGQTATYVCQRFCALETVGSDGTTEPWSGSAPRRAKPTPLANDVEVETKGDTSLMKLELVLNEKALLRITATPEKRADVVQFKLVRQTDSEDSDECNLEFMVNGQVLATPKAIAKRNGNVLAHRVQIGRGLIADFGTAGKIAMRACHERWSLKPEQVEKVREFMDRFQEEMAWNAGAKGSTGGMLAPSGGWPEWITGNATLPSTVEGPKLEAPVLFKKLSPSVFQLEASTSTGTSQGSAVAVSPTELITNCHVVQGALKLVLKQGKQQWPAKLQRADPKTDRCTVTAEGATFQPVAGIRSYDSLEVGEAAYTLGSPVGLELTLSNGIVSGRREEDSRPYIQTTAPISPGSSGGGLFDARGNLIGVTTLVLAGREHLNQALNFAIPADTYFKP